VTTNDPTTTRQQQFPNSHHAIQAFIPILHSDIFQRSLCDKTRWLELLFYRI
jgi:hypothetical protein